MEELTEALAGSFEISFELNKTTAPHPRFSQYKQKTSNSDQDSRREQLLDQQKSRRYDFISHVRKLTEDDWFGNEDSHEKNEADEVESMEIETKLRKPGRYYKDQLMLSEWLVEVPCDFETEWITVICPVAKRCLIVASKGTTRAFTKSGYCLNSFPSHLPGGYRRNKEKDSTILDCLYSEANKTYYILDLMCWNGHAVYESETEFRFYWLHEKLKEFPTLGEKSKTNPYKFVALPSFRCTQDDIASAISSAIFEIDGVLFYHKRAHYLIGSTPLVVWLKPYMLEEILGISVPECQMTHRPQDYTNYSDHMKKVETDQKKALNQPKIVHGRRGRGKRKESRNMDGEMDTSQVETPVKSEAEEFMQETVKADGT